ncbi:hypothetical protein AC578_465 [Pseudocercospora eumusae]|uniref:Uncharacterized protein n=1 Tax=Pseudocercospora eumusae TaxID=321146 RepID=A0A139HY79_9PEZI|nr:hypothetical protein AC578_465 [Pseudocercospora eumusae]
MNHLQDSREAILAGRGQTPAHDMSVSYAIWDMAYEAYALQVERLHYIPPFTQCTPIESVPWDAWPLEWAPFRCSSMCWLAMIMVIASDD